MTNKTYVLDTSAILSEGRNTLYSFEKNDVVIPLIVIRELQKKRHDGDLGHVARSVLREILSVMKRGDIQKGVSLGEQYGNLRIEFNHIETSGLPETIKETLNNDVRILAVAANLNKEAKEKGEGEVVLITKDIELRIYALTVGLACEDLQDEDDPATDKFIRSVQQYDVDDAEIDALYAHKAIKLPLEVPNNTGVILVGTSTGKSALAIAKSGYEFKLVEKRVVQKSEGKSAEQKILLDLLMDEKVGVVSTSGTAGSGKSYLMLAAALDLVRNSGNDYQKIVIFRPVNPAGGQHQDLGFLPGDINEKLAPHAQAVWDTLGTIVPAAEVERIKREGIIEIASISHVRGRTLANCCVILDESQNLESSTIVTLISRLGVNSRMFIGWDTAQRDAQFIGKYDGIYKVVKKLHGHKLFGHVTLKKSERSAISAMVANLLED